MKSDERPVRTEEDYRDSPPVHRASADGCRGDRGLKGPRRLLVRYDRMGMILDGRTILAATVICFRILHHNTIQKNGFVRARKEQTGKNFQGFRQTSGSYF